MASKTTQDLIKGLENMLKDRGSMTVKEVQLLEEVILHLREHDDLESEQRMANGIAIIQLLTRIFLDPAVRQSLVHLSSHLIDKLL
jgi:hypothetical protein